jgi:Flp pilus assembly pilin Flp
MKFIERFWKEEQGQDLIEYSLLLGFVALFSTAMYSSLSGNISTIWTNASGSVQNVANSGGTAS